MKVRIGGGNPTPKSGKRGYEARDSMTHGVATLILGKCEGSVDQPWMGIRLRKIAQRKFRSRVNLLGTQSGRTGRRILNRLPAWNPWREMFTRNLATLGRPLRR